jgi:hypothetical protein
MENLAPHIHRQRMVVEFRRRGWITEAMIAPYFTGLAKTLGMNVLDVFTSLAPGAGWAGMVHWDFSGAALMAWDEPGDVGFGTVDLHSCKPFTYTDAVECTRGYFEATDLAWHPVLPDLASHPVLPVGTYLARAQ